MSLYRIEREPDMVAGAERKMWHVRHYVQGDPNPTVSSRPATMLPQAWRDALGSAAKMCIIHQSHGMEYCDVEVEDGRVYRVRVERIK